VRVTSFTPEPFTNTREDSSFQGDPLMTVAPRLGLQYSITDILRFKSSFGRYYQFVNIVPLGGGGLSIMDIWFPSDHSIPPASATHYVSGFEMDFPGEITVTLEGYYKDMPQLYQFDMSAARVYSGKDLFNPGSGWAYGADVNLEKKSGRVTGWISYSLGWTKRKFETLNYGKPYYPTFDRRHSVKTVGTYRLNRRWSFNFAWTYGTGQGYTQPLGHYRMDLPDDDMPVVIGGERNNARMPNYHRLDVGVRHNKALPNNRILKSWSWYVQIFNVYNHRNLWHKNVIFNLDGTVDVTEVRMLPILPTAGIELSF